MASSLSSSSTASLFQPMNGMLAKWTLDKRPIQAAVFNAIGRTAEKLDGLLSPLVSLVVDYLQVQKEERCGVFGEKEWADHFGTVPPAPALHPSIEEIWQGPCSVYTGRRVCETHMFVYIPATVNGLPLTLKSLKQYFPETEAGYRNEVLEQLGDRPSGHGCWVLMTKEGIPGSENRSFTEQINIVTALGTTALPAYEVPRILDATVCVLAQFASSKIRLFSDTYIRCQEVVSKEWATEVTDYPATLGRFIPEGLTVDYCDNDNDRIFMGVLRKFF